MSVQTEIDNLIEVIASRLPASMENPDNKKLERQFRNSMAAYFQDLADVFPFERIEALYKKQVKEVSSPPKAPQWDDWIDALLQAFRAEFSQSVFNHLVTIYVTGSTQMVSYGRTMQLGLPILYEGPPIHQVIEWAQNYGAQLVTKMDQETKRRLAGIVSDGIENKRGVDGLTRDIKNAFRDMSKDRADMIAQTETNSALSQASMDRMQDMGVDGKEWIIIGDDRTCPICNGNADQGIIPINQAFQSGHMQTPGHPRCRCATAPARMNKDAAYMMGDDPEKWATQNVADNVHYTSGMNLEGLNTINSTISSLNSRFLNSRKLNYIGDLKGFEEQFSKKIKFPKDAKAAYVPRLDSIVIRSGVTDAKKAISEEILTQKLVNQRYPVSSLIKQLEDSNAPGELLNIAKKMKERKWAVSMSPKGVIAHEYGHRIYYQYPDSLARKQLLDITKTEYQNGWGEVLSIYGSSSESEFFAESFAAYIMKDYSRLSPKLLKWFQVYDGSIIK